MKKDPFLKQINFFQWISNLLFNPKKYFVFTPWSERIGHLAYEIITAISIAQRDDKKLILIPPFKNVNRELYKCTYSCKTLKPKTIKYYLLYLFLAFIGFFTWFYNGCRRYIAKHNSTILKIIPKLYLYPRIGIEKGKWWRYRIKGVDYYLDLDFLMSQNAKVKLNVNQKNRGNRIREKMGVPHNAWFVCIHVRENGYLGNVAHHNHRDSNISNYLQAIKYITEKGGWVIRMGDPTMKPLPQMNNVIDYAHSKYRNELMDLYWVSECKFFLGCDSGLLLLTWLFNKPLCSVNFAAVNLKSSFRELDVIVPKHIFSLKDKRVLSFEEVIQSDIYNEDLPSSNYIFIENTPDEILNTVTDYLRLIEENNIEDWDTPLQDIIRNTIHEKYKTLISADNIDDGKKDVWAGALNTKGMYGNYYLRKCYKYSSYLENITNQHLNKNH